MRSQDLGPILGLGAAGPGVDGDDGVFLVFLAAQQQLELPIGEVSSRFARSRATSLRAWWSSSSCARSRSTSRSSSWLSFRAHSFGAWMQGAPFPEDVRGPGLVVPELRGGHQFFQMPQSDLFAGQIKDDLEGFLNGPVNSFNLGLNFYVTGNIVSSNNSLGTLVRKSRD